MKGEINEQRKEFSNLTCWTDFYSMWKQWKIRRNERQYWILLGQDIPLKIAYILKRNADFFNRQVRLDVYAWDDDDTVYDTEAQKKKTKNLPKRSRFYQAVLDMICCLEALFNN